MGGVQPKPSIWNGIANEIKWKWNRDRTDGLEIIWLLTKLKMVAKIVSEEDFCFKIIYQIMKNFNCV